MPVGFLAKLGADAGWAAMRLSESLARGRGVDYAMRLGRAVGRTLWLLRARRRLSMRNAAVVLGDLPVSGRRRVVREGYMQSGSYWPELVNYIHDRPNRILRNVTVEGREHLDAALARGSGVIAPSIHLGNFSLIGLWMAQAVYEFRFMIRVPHNERFFERFNFLSRKSGLGLIWDRPRRACVRTSHQVLAGGGIVCSLLDQATMGQRGVKVEFFGRPFHAFGGTMTIALKTGAAVVPMYIARGEEIRHRLVIEPELPMVRTGDRRAEVRANLQRVMRRFEEWIRRHPGQWWWPNRRWQDA